MDATAVVAILTGFGAMFAAFYKVVSEVNDREKKDLKDSNKYILSRIDDMKIDVESLRKELSVVRRERDEAQTEVVKLRKEIKDLRLRLDKYEKSGN